MDDVRINRISALSDAIHDVYYHLNPKGKRHFPSVKLKQKNRAATKVAKASRKRNRK